MFMVGGRGKENSGRGFYTCNLMLLPSNNVGDFAHSSLIRTSWTIWLHPNQVDLEKQSNNVLGTESLEYLVNHVNNYCRQ